MSRTSIDSDIPSHHKWFFDNVCDKRDSEYLKYRRMIEVTYHQPKAIIVPKVSRKPAFDGNFDNPSWLQSAVSEPFVLNGIHSLHSSPRAQTTFKALRFEDELYIAIRAQDPDGIGRSVSGRSILLNGRNIKYLPYYSDYVSIVFDTNHQHDEYIEFFATPGGGKGSLRGRRNASLYPVHPISTAVSKEECGIEFNSQWELKVKCDRDRSGWTAMFKIPFSLLSEDGKLPAVIGFNAHRFKHSGLPEQSVWSEVRWFGENVEVPMRFGDMYLNDVSVTLEQLWLGEWLLGKNEVIAEVQNHTSSEIKVEWIVDVGFDNDTKVKTSRGKLSLAAGRNIIHLPYRIHNIGRGFLRLRLSDSKTGGVIYDGRYWLESALRLGERVDTKGADYNLKRSADIAERLPRMIRMTTADGAPSDFYLQSADGRVKFNLMERGVMRKIAKMIERRFSDEDERLAAASIFVRQSDVMVYELIENFSEITNSPLSIMRFGSGICGAFATVIKGLVEQIRPPGGGRYVAYRCGLAERKAKKGELITLEAHTLVIVYCPDGRRVILNDGEVYFSEKTGRLLAADDVDELKKYLPLISNIDTAMIIDSGSLVWPAGGPIE